MNKLGRKVSALLLAAAVTVSTVIPAFAAGSPVSGKVVSESTVSGTTTGNTTIAVTDVTSTTDTATIPSSITVNGKTYDVDVIRTNTIKEKYASVTLVLRNTTKVEAQVAKLKKAKKTKKIVITAAAGQKIKASQFSKKAFKKFKGKIIVKKSAMTKKQFRKLKKKLRKGGFKGKIRYKK